LRGIHAKNLIVSHIIQTLAVVVAALLNLAVAVNFIFFDEAHHKAQIL
jgi:hypothetical protein